MQAQREGVRLDKGMTLIELLIVIAILTGFLLLAAPTAGKIIRRSQSLAAYSSVQQVLATARLQAVKRGVNVVVLIDVTPQNRIRLFTFQDRANDEESPLPADEAAAAANFVQDSGFIKGASADEPTLGEVILPSNVVVWKQGGTAQDLGAGIAFDGYNGNPALTNRVGFLPTGGLAPPEDAGSGLPSTTGGRGIYFADVHGKNYFRVTVDSDLSGRLRTDKFRPGSGYEAQTQTNRWAWF